jgi:hypothetical protein
MPEKKAGLIANLAPLCYHIVTDRRGQDLKRVAPMRRTGRSQRKSERARGAAALPGFLRPFFWESALTQVHPKRYWFYIIERLIEYGDDQAIHWLKENYTPAQIAEVVRTSRTISRNTANLWALILKIPRGKIRCFSEPSLLPHGAFSRG